MNKRSHTAVDYIKYNDIDSNKIYTIIFTFYYNSIIHVFNVQSLSRGKWEFPHG